MLLVSYSTFLPSEWLLGLSAALHGVPLVLVGLGRAWGGHADKFYGALSAARLLAQMPRTRKAAVVFADAFDTMVVNPPALTGALRALSKAKESYTLLSSECNSWPHCYRPLYAQDGELSRCLPDPRRTCYINSGVYASSSSSELATLLPLVIQGLNVSGMFPVERMYDQASLIRLFLRRKAAGLHGRLRIDSDSSLFLSLYRCNGQYDQVLSRRKGVSRCAERLHEPLDALDFNGTSARYRAQGNFQAPLIVHSNGDQSMGQRLQSRHFSSLHAALRPAPAALLQYPVLLLDSKQFGRCGVTNLSELLAEARRSGACSLNPQCRSKRRP